MKEIKKGGKGLGESTTCMSVHTVCGDLLGPAVGSSLRRGMIAVALSREKMQFVLVPFAVYILNMTSSLTIIFICFVEAQEHPPIHPTPRVHVAVYTVRKH